MTAFAHANEISAAAIDRAAQTLKLLDPAKGSRRAAAAAHQPRDVRQRRSARRDPVRAQGRLVPGNRRRGARARSARGAGQRDAVGIVERGRDRPRRRLRRHRRPPAGAAQRVDRRQAGRPPRDRQLRAWRALSLRPLVRTGDVEPRDRRGAGAGAGQSGIGRRAGGRNAGRAWPRLVRRAAPRSGRPRAGRRFQPQGHVGLFRPHRAARRRARA